MQILVRPVFSVVGPSIFFKYSRIEMDLTTLRLKYDFVIRSLPSTIQKGSQTLSIQTAQVDYCKLILLYLQNLHEDTDAKGISLHINKYDFLQGEKDQASSLIDVWSLKPKKNKQIKFENDDDKDNPLL